MANVFRWIAALVVIPVLSGAASSEAEQSGTSQAQPSTVTEVTPADLATARLRALRPGLPIMQVVESPVPGLFEVELSGGQSLFASASGEYVIGGDMYQLTETELVNLGEQNRNEMRRELIGSVDESDFVTFAPSGTAKATVTVFTDVDCGYCRKLHMEMANYHEQGIAVRYLAYPRAGIKSESYDRIVSAWCADNPNTALTQLKSGKEIPAADCDNPVADHFEMGRLVGVTGTPAIVTAEGRLLPGYYPAADLAKRLGI